MGLALSLAASHANTVAAFSGPHMHSYLACKHRKMDKSWRSSILDLDLSQAQGCSETATSSRITVSFSLLIFCTCLEGPVFHPNSCETHYFTYDL